MATEHPKARTLTRYRRWGYRVFPGDTFSYLIHVRPAHFLPVAVHFLIGFVAANGLSLTGVDGEGWKLPLAVAIWVICGSGGATAINTAIDRDTGDIGYVACPPAAPRHLTLFSVGLLVLGQLVSLALSWEFACAYAFLALAGVAYSVPPVRLKGVPGADVVLNAAAYGAATPMAGWLVSQRPLDVSGVLLLAGFGCLFSALFPLTQIYQIPDDRASGTRTMASVWGARAALTYSLLAAFVGFSLLLAAVAYRHTGATWACMLVVLPGIVWEWHVGRWLSKCALFSKQEHAGMMYRIGNVWFLTGLATASALLIGN